MLIAAVALILIGPKDMPVAIEAVTDMIKKARRMAGEFQTHVDEMMREANLDEVREQINEIRNFDIRGEIERAVDPDGSLARHLRGNPLEPHGRRRPWGDGAGRRTRPPSRTTERGREARRWPKAARPSPRPAHAAGARRRPASSRRIRDQHTQPPAFIPPGISPPGVYRPQLLWRLTRAHPS